MTIKMRLKMKNRSQRYDINRPAILDKIYGAKWKNPVKLDKKRKVWYQILCAF